MSEVEQTIAFLLANDDGELVLPGVGRLGTRRYGAYVGRNPRTGEPVDVPAARLPFLRVDPALYCALNGYEEDDLEGEEESDIPGVRAAFADALGEEIGPKLLAGETVIIDDLGTFAVIEKRARPGVNPDTGEKITVPPRRLVTFKAAASLKARLRDS